MELAKSRSRLSWWQLQSADRDMGGERTVAAQRMEVSYAD